LLPGQEDYLPCRTTLLLLYLNVVHFKKCVAAPQLFPTAVERKVLIACSTDGEIRLLIVFRLQFLFEIYA
jgi:hypothetical protein